LLSNLLLPSEVFAPFGVAYQFRNALHVKLVLYPIGSLQTAIMRHAPNMFAILEDALLVSNHAIKFPHFVDTFAKLRVTRRFSFELMLRRWSERGLGNPSKPPVWK
jgi:hypothetical protein